VALLTDPVVDACTLNNAMNALQIALLVALLRWVRSGAGAPPSR
jgi:hypothetical protein